MISAPFIKKSPYSITASLPQVSGQQEIYNKCNVRETNETSTGRRKLLLRNVLSCLEFISLTHPFGEMGLSLLGRP